MDIRVAHLLILVSASVTLRKAHAFFPQLSVCSGTVKCQVMLPVDKPLISMQLTNSFHPYTLEERDEGSV